MVPEIVQKYLESKGFDGLVSCDGECGCGFEDFAPCGEIQMTCEAGYKVPCTCEDGWCRYHIVTKKQEE